MNSIMPDTDQGHLASAAVAIYTYACELNTPFATYKPRLFQDGNQWCALYGENIMEGVCGFGTSPAKAVAAFNCAWCEDIPAEVAALQEPGAEP